MILCAVMAVSCVRHDRQPETKPGLPGHLLDLWTEYSRSGEFDSLLVSAGDVFRKSKACGDTSAILYAGTTLAQTFLFASDLDSVRYYLDELKQFAEGCDNPELVVSLFNTAGIFSIVSGLDYASAMENYMKGLEAAEGGASGSGKLTLLLNIAQLYYTRGDTAGIRYAEDAGLLASLTDPGPYYKCYIHLSLAQMHFLSGHYQEAASELSVCDTIAVRERILSSFLPSMSLKARLLEEEGRYAAAEEVFCKAGDYIAYADPEAVISYYLAYGDLCRRGGRPDKAVGLYLDGTLYAESSGYLVFRLPLYKSLAEILYARGDYARALDYSMSFIALSDSISGLDREREFNRLVNTYQDNRYRMEVLQKELSLAVQERRTVAVASLAVILLVVLVFLWLYASKQRNMNRILVARYQEYNRRTTTRDYSDSKLFADIEALMANEKLYLKKDISLQMIADILGTNKTYISASINKYAGVSFYRYLDTYRIKEATAILSRPGDRTPFKSLSADLGYNSPSVFYAAFCRETGVTPGVFRKMSSE